jgi:hypothetical protein
MQACEHESAGDAPRETLREHMMRAHGCTEAMVRWVLYNRSLAVGYWACKLDVLDAVLGETFATTFVATLTEPSEAEGFRQGYRFARALESGE